MSFKLLLTGALVASIMFAVACGGDGDDKPSGRVDGYDATQQASTGSRGTPTPCYGRGSEGDANTPSAIQPTAQPVPGGATTTKTYAAEPPMTIDQDKKYVATIKTEVGDIKVDLFPKDAPRHVNNFVFLARDGFYDGVTFHRVIPGFMAQAGDPEGTGRGGPGYTIPDEVNGCKFLDGTLGMAKTQLPNSAGSQWFLDYAPQPSLDGGYTVFGQIIEGRDVLDKVSPRDPARATTPGTKINTIEIEEK